MKDNPKNFKEQLMLYRETFSKELKDDSYNESELTTLRYAVDSIDYILENKSFFSDYWCLVGLQNIENARALVERDVLLEAAEFETRAEIAESDCRTLAAVLNGIGSIAEETTGSGDSTTAMQEKLTGILNLVKKVENLL